MGGIDHRFACGVSGYAVGLNTENSPQRHEGHKDWIVETHFTSKSLRWDLPRKLFVGRQPACFMSSPMPSTRRSLPYFTKSMLSARPHGDKRRSPPKS